MSGMLYVGTMEGSTVTMSRIVELADKNKRCRSYRGMLTGMLDSYKKLR